MSTNGANATRKWGIKSNGASVSSGRLESPLDFSLFGTQFSSTKPEQNDKEATTFHAEVIHIIAESGYSIIFIENISNKYMNFLLKTNNWLFQWNWRDFFAI